MIRAFARTSQRLLDVAVLATAFVISYLLRFDWVLPAEIGKRLLVELPYVVAFKYLLLVLVGIPRFSWRYVGLREVTRIFWAMGIGALALVVARFVAVGLQGSVGIAQYALVPLGVAVIDFTLAFLGIAGVRVVRRIAGERSESHRRRGADVEDVPTMLVGAGQAGLLVAKEITGRPDLGIRPVGFLDDDRFKWETVVHGIPVVGPTRDLAALCRKAGARQVLITIANAPGGDIRRIKELCDEAGLSAKILPGLYEIVGGKVNLSRIRSVSIEDLLRRDPIDLELPEIAEEVGGATVLVTGAGGSIGSEICRQVSCYQPKALILLDQAENALFHVHRELQAAHPELAERIVPCIADIADAARLEAVFGTHRPTIVFHAAAHKHVPMMEWNPGEAVKNNVFGTKTLADIAHAHGVRQFVMISTDKAVNPTSVMGCSKRIAEIYVQALAQRSPTRFVTVRFGNVLGSNGSVIPIFQEQIARGGPVTVTHPEMRRYFMTIPEACQLVLQAGTMGSGGEIFILDMGEPVKIVDLATDLIRLSGLRPGEDIRIEFSGIRPGEKLFEELSVADEHADKTRHPKIFIGRLRPHDWTGIHAQLVELRSLAEEGIAERIRAKFGEIVPEYRPVLLNAPTPGTLAPDRAIGAPVASLARLAAR